MLSVWASTPQTGLSQQQVHSANKREKTSVERNITHGFQEASPPAVWENMSADHTHGGENGSQRPFPGGVSEFRPTEQLRETTWSFLEKLEPTALRGPAAQPGNAPKRRARGRAAGAPPPPLRRVPVPGTSSSVSMKVPGSSRLGPLPPRRKRRPRGSLPARPVVTPGMRARGRRD